jgi:hypothetical protein
MMAGNREPGDPGIGPDPDPSDEPQDDIEEFDIPEDGNELDESAEEVEEEELAAEPEPEPQRRLSRRERQSENWRERALRAEAERDVYTRQQQRPQAPAPVDPQIQQQRIEAEYERISMLPPQDQVRAVHQIIQRENALTQLRIYDQQDTRDFQRLQAEYPAARRLAGRVEEILQAERAAGVYSRNREQILDMLIGQETRTRGARTTNRERERGAANVRRQTTRPSGGRSGGVAGGGRRGRTQEQIDHELLSTPIRDTM